MRVGKATTKARIAVLGFVVMAWAPPLHANSLYFPNQPGNAGDNTFEDIDFETPSIPTGTSGNLNGKKYWTVNLATYNSKNQCFTITTWANGPGDTRIWVYDSAINDYRSLNNTSNGSVFASARIWISPPSNGGRYVSPVISAASSAHNTMKFGVSVSKSNSTTTEAQCTTGSTYKAKASGNTFVNAN